MPIDCNSKVWVTGSGCDMRLLVKGSSIDCDSRVYVCDHCPCGEYEWHPGNTLTLTFDAMSTCLPTRGQKSEKVHLKLKTRIKLQYPTTDFVYSVYKATATVIAHADTIVYVSLFDRRSEPSAE